MTHQDLTQCPHCKGSGYTTQDARKAEHDRESNVAMNVSMVVFAISGFLGAMAFGGNIWTVLLLTFVMAVGGAFFGAWMAHEARG